MFKRAFASLVVGACIISLSFHFVVEGLGGVHDHLIGQQLSGLFHCHDGDLFTLSESSAMRPSQPAATVFTAAGIYQVSRPLPPPFHPPKPQ
jgi:hypothetical protein